MSANQCMKQSDGPKGRECNLGREGHTYRENHCFGALALSFLEGGLANIWVLLFSEDSKTDWRTGGVVAKKSFLCQRLRPLFCALFPMPPLRRKGDTFLEVLFACFWGSVSLQPHPSNPFSKPSDFHKRQLDSRLSFPATGPPDPGRVSEECQKGVSEGVSEGFLKGF